MRIVQPVNITAAELISTNVVGEYDEWEAGTYSTGERVVHGMSAWEALEDDVTSEPGADPLDWLRLGYSNQWRMFRDGRDSQSTGEGDITVTLSTGSLITTIALLGLQGLQAELTITDPVDGVVYSRIEPLVDIGVMDWWEYFFLPYDVKESAVFDGAPPYPGAEIELKVSGGTELDEVAIGRVVMGAERELGGTLYGTGISSVEYSVKERDTFGNLTLVPRRTIRLIDYDVSVDTSQVDFVVQLLERISAQPTLFIGSKEFSSTVEFGVYRDYTQNIDSPSVSFLTLQVEGF